MILYVFFWMQLSDFSHPEISWFSLNCWNFGIKFRLVWLQVLHLWLYLGLELCATRVFSDSSRITQALGPTPANLSKSALTALSDFEHGPLELPVIWEYLIIFVCLDTWWDAKLYYILYIYTIQAVMESQQTSWVVYCPVEASCEVSMEIASEFACWQFVEPGR